MLFITKSANNLELLAENLDILSGKEGDIIKTNYRSRWIQPEVLSSLPRKGTEACIVFSDPPWDVYVPVRLIRLIEDAHSEGDKLTLEFALGKRVNTPDIQKFTEQLKVVIQKQYFVIDSRDVQVQKIDLPENQAWRQTIRTIVGAPPDGKKNISALERYLSTLFLRVDEILDKDEQPISLKDYPYQVGHQYTIVLDCFAPHLSQEKISQMEIVGISDPPIVGAPSILAVHDGRLSLKMTPVYSGKTKLKIWVQPEQTRSSQIGIECTVIQTDATLLQQKPVGAVASSASEQNMFSKPVLNQVELQALFTKLLGIFPKDANPTHNYKRSLAHELERLPLDEDGKRFLAEEQAVSAWRTGNFDDAFNILDVIGPAKIRSQEAVAAYFISAWKTNRTPDLNLLIDRLVISLNPDLAKIIREALPWKSVVTNKEILEQLFTSDIFKPEYTHHVIKDESNGKIISDLIRYLVEERILDKSSAYRELRDWLEVDQTIKHTNISPVARLCFEYGIEEEVDIAWLLNQFGDKILSEKELSKAQELYELASRLDTPKRIRFLEALADLIKDYSSLEWRRFSGGIFMETGKHYLYHSNQTEFHISLAGEYLRDARKLFSEDKKTDLNKLLDEWKQRAEGTETIKDYLAQFDEVKRNCLADIVKGKKVVFVGGLTLDNDFDKIAKEIGFASGEHIEIYREKGDDLSALKKRVKNSQVHYVIDMISFGRHHTDLKEACKANKDVNYIPFTSRSRHKNAFLAALFKHHRNDIAKKLGNS